MKKTTSLTEIRWAYSEVHSQMHYNGLSIDEAIKVVEAKLDGTQPADLFVLVKEYHQRQIEK